MRGTATVGYTLFEDAALNPGGSGIPVDFGFATGGLLRSITHCGGGGGRDDIVVLLSPTYVKGGTSCKLFVQRQS